MTIERDTSGWGWFEEAPTPEMDPAEEQICRAFARCFAGIDGELAIEHLTRLILERRLSPQASDAELWHLEGQRFAVAYILNMSARGRK